MDWTTYYMRFALLAAEKSKDSTQVGAVLIGPDGEIRLTAYNGPPRGVQDLPERFVRPVKYLYAAAEIMCEEAGVDLVRLSRAREIEIGEAA